MPKRFLPCAFAAVGVLACSSEQFLVAADGAAPPGKGDAAVEAGDDAGGSLVWSWEADSTNGWQISDTSPVSGGGYVDSCKCSSAGTGGCVSNESVHPGSSPGTVTFDSGPQESGGTTHQYDGFLAWNVAVPVRPGKPHTAAIDIVDLAASIAGATGAETGDSWRPQWSLEVRDHTDPSNVLGALRATWGNQAQCHTCPPLASDLGVKTLSFTPPGASVDLYVSASLRSSQCASEVYSVQVTVDFLRITSP